MSLGINTSITNTREQPSTLSRGKTLYVGGSGGDNYTRIQDAVNDSVDGDTVYVYDDSSPYYEEVLINKSINLIGENKYTTAIDADKQGIVVTITKDLCLISGFTLKNCKMPFDAYKYVVVKIDSSNNVTLEGNIISIGVTQYHSSVAAVYISNSSYNKILNNYIFEDDIKPDGSGIILGESSSNNLIFGNDVSVYIEGIGTRWDSNCNHNVISENNILKNKIGIRLNKNCNHNVISENNIYNNTIGSEFFNCSYNEIINNTIEYNSERGIKLSDAHHNTISGNKILENGDGTSFNCGIRIVGEKASNNYISDNDVSNNSPIGIFILDAYDNAITNNNLIDNNCEGSPRERWWGNAYFICSFKLGKLFNLNS